MAEAQIVTCPNCGKKNRLPVAAGGTPRCGNCHEPLPWIVEASAGDFDAAIGATVPVLVEWSRPPSRPSAASTPAA